MGMTIQNILAELRNIKEQAVNEEGISKDSILEAISDLIHDVEGNDGIDFDDDDVYDSFETTDFTQLEVM